MGENLSLTTLAVITGLIVLAIILTYFGFKKIPRRQKPRYKTVAEQAQLNSKEQTKEARDSE